MPTRRVVYVAFDYDDLGVKQSMIAESQRPDCPWEFIDNSIPRVVAEHWALEARRRIGASQCVIVLCGEQAHQAQGVAVEVQLAQELGKPYFLVSATRKGVATRPKHARESDRIWTYRWPTLLALLNGQSPPSDAEIV